MKKILLSLITGLIFSILITAHSQSIHSDLASNLIRLHIVANSDSPVDQNVKLKIRDRILHEMSPYFENAQTTEQYQKIITENLDIITSIANDELQKNNLSYKAKTYFGKFNFPTKVYNNIMLPKGDYNAVRVVLGNAEGQNWWCVMFPPLCFTNEVSGEISEKDKNALKGKLSNESYSIITNDGKLDLKIKFKILELFE